MRGWKDAGRAMPQTPSKPTPLSLYVSNPICCLLAPGKRSDRRPGLSLGTPSLHQPGGRQGARGALPAPRRSPGGGPGFYPSPASTPAPPPPRPGAAAAPAGAARGRLRSPAPPPAGRCRCPPAAPTGPARPGPAERDRPLPGTGEGGRGAAGHPPTPCPCLRPRGGGGGAATERAWDGGERSRGSAAVPGAGVFITVCVPPPPAASEPGWGGVCVSLGARPAGLSRCPGKKAADNSPAPPFSTTEGALLKSRWPARAESQKITIWGGGGGLQSGRRSAGCPVLTPGAPCCRRA